MLSWQIPGGGLCALEPVITGIPPDPLVAFAELGRMKLGESDLQAVLGRVAELARRTLPGMAGASVTLVESDRAFTAAFSGQLALDLDETQYRDGFGPCLEVAQSAGTVTVPDMAAATPWPAFAPQSLAFGAHSSLWVAPPSAEALCRRRNCPRRPPRRIRPGRHRDNPALRRARRRRHRQRPP